jgi:hypothetical protein
VFVEVVVEEGDDDDGMYLEQRNQRRETVSGDPSFTASIRVLTDKRYWTNN